jgi:hypothetical protein
MPVHLKAVSDGQYGRLTGRCMAVALAGICLTCGSTSAFTSEQVVGTKIVLDLESVCRPEVIQSAVAKLLPTITVKAVANPSGPALAGGAIFTTPLCEFPEMAHYSGKGDVKDAANWSCPANDTSMLKVGESGRQAGVIE